MRTGSSGETTPKGESLAEPSEERPRVHVDGDLTRRWAGVVPPPDIVAEYKLISPDFPDKIVQLAENEALFRNDLQKRIKKTEKRSKTAGLLVVVTLIVFSAVMTAIFLTRDLHAASLVVSAIGALVAVFGILREKYSKYIVSFLYRRSFHVENTEQIKAVIREAERRHLNEELKWGKK